MFNELFNRDGAAQICRNPLWITMAALLTCGLVPQVSRSEDEAILKAEEILEKSIESTGGRAAYEKLRNRVTKGTFSIAGMDSKAEMITYAAAPRNQYVVINSEMLGKIESGTIGEVAWEITTIMGPQIKKGEERAAILRGATFNTDLHWKDLYKSVETVGVEDVDGRSAYKIIMTPQEGKPETAWYDKETFRNVKVETELETAMGTMPLVVRASEYKQVDGVLIPHKIVQEIVGLQKVEMFMESVEHNVEMPPDRFKIPPEIQALLDKQPKESKAEEKKAEPAD